ncbi:PF20097 family protein [Solibaculum mannosilyticum]|uniref:DUF6487 domain-containing protein n=1 Tax=Solibaculum mannosilyticum TaxID=2780922 RepID=A0A7I8D2Y2_9FIRM|nr:PF20097 family protein [Solibaculum mannosilyticum]MCO7136120.1 PF20097 family protein [[Clostridium] leptum]BCI61188.1 hypothetical protein C12CBH8_18270 [Solibaculum mannosilyticum]CZT56045.1 hypothetical protein BN3661_01141 [Eubacteriaceae bacterium CHKCI005]
MNCPFCGAQMQQGNVVTENSVGLFFLPPDQSPGFWLGDTSNSIEKKGGVVLDGPYHFRINHTELPAFLCGTCRKIIFDY